MERVAVGGSGLTVGVSGLGLLGVEIADRLRRGGCGVCGFDCDPQRRDEWSRRGGTAVDSLTRLADRSLVVLCLPTDREVETVLDELVPPVVAAASGAVGSDATAPDAVAQRGRPVCVIDCTTGDPLAKQRFADRLRTRGVGYVEAAVGGSAQDLAEGRAVLMVGGEPADVRLVEPVLGKLAAQWFDTGNVGNAAKAKLVFNLVLGLHRAVLAEGLTFARRCGLDPHRMLEVLRSGAAYSAVMDAKGPRMLERRFTPVARLSQHHKDVRLILQQARRCGARLPLTELHETLLAIAEQLGCGESDNAAIIAAFELLAEADMQATEPPIVRDPNGDA